MVNVLNSDLGGSQQDPSNSGQVPVDAADNGLRSSGAMRPAEYTIPGVLHFIQHEWARFEMDRAQWDVERAELNARIAFLQGERQGLENLKCDLIRRIKMLEYALRQERMKYHKLRYGTDLDMSELATDEADAAEVGGADALESAIQSNSNTSWRQGRQLLRQYLGEIGYTDTILNVRSFRIRSLLGFDPDNMEENQPPDGEDKFKSELDADEERVLKEFDFLASDAGKDDGSAVTWDINYQAISQMKEQYRIEKLNKIPRGQERPPAPPAQRFHDNLEKEDVSFGRTTTDGGDESQTAGDLVSRLGELTMLNQMDEPDPLSYDISGEDSAAVRKTWECQYTLKNHYDSVRGLCFHPVEPVLVTASEDCTLKMWSLQKPAGSPVTKTSTKPNAATQPDIEPVCTLRGHTAPVLSLCMSPTGEACYSGSADSTIRCWQLPSPNIDPYGSYAQQCDVLRAHSDAVWSIAVHSCDNKLLSASADGTVRLWDANVSTRTFSPEGKDEGVPTSVDFVNTDPGQALAAYTNSGAFIYDLETGKSILSFESKEQHSALSKGQINQIISHPTLGITITAHEDRLIRFFDNNTGKLIDCMVAHLDAVTCLAIDPNGLYLLSGSHDCSIRMWNLDNKHCLQEITAHRRKFDESIFAVAFHPSRPLIGSAGADSIVKVFV